MPRIGFLHALVLATLSFAVTSSSAATVVYDQPHTGTGTLYQSSWWLEDGSDWDQLTWENFTLSSDTAITQVQWRGGYQYNAQYGPLINFTVSFYPSIAAGTEPDIAHPPLAEYTTGGTANQTPVGNFGGVAMYDYSFTLPAAFIANASTKYWVEILANQPSIPDWCLAAGSGGNSSHFRFVEGLGMYQMVPGDVAFRLLASDAPTFTIAATAEPPQAGTVIGAGAYPSGSNATLTALPNQGYGFVDWTEGASVVSTNAAYTFLVSGNRSLVAHFTSAYTVTTSASPIYGGSTAGDGTFNSGNSVTVSANPNAGFVFSNWTEFGATVGTSPSYTFAAAANRNLVANFALDPLSIAFDFDNAPGHTSLPISLSNSGLTADFSATGAGFSIQPADTMGFTPLGFAGLCLYPNSIFPADLHVSFSKVLTSLSIMYSPQELGCDDSATMKVTVFLDGTQVSSATTTAPNPGTYPTGTLSITAASGFDSAVVEHQSPPPTCQDWGPIFLADNLIVTVAETMPACPADATHNGIVDVDDLLLVINQWGPAGGAADITGNGVVDVDDLLAVINTWGNCP